MRKISLLVLLLLVSFSYSQTYYLNIWSNGNVTSLPVHDIQKITFADISDTFGNGSEINIIQAFRLFQNYPNPFNPRTTFEYQIPAEGRVMIQIFNLKGQLIKSFERTHAHAGTYNAIWDGTDQAGQTVASGVYLYQVTYADAVMAKKMLFLK